MRIKKEFVDPGFTTNPEALPGTISLEARPRTVDSVDRVLLPAPYELFWKKVVPLFEQADRFSFLSSEHGL